MPLLLMVLATAVLLFAGPVSGHTIYIRPDGTGDVPTIQAAVDSSAAAGDTVLLADGTFTSDGNHEIDCFDKAVTIISESGDPDLCVIQCDSRHVAFEDYVAFYFRASEHGVARLEGVTITNGCAAVICDSSSNPVIANCIFRDNGCAAYEIGNAGAGLRCYPNSSPTVINCTFRGNQAVTGGGAWCMASSANFINTTFIENTSDTGGGLGAYGGSLTLINCTFAGNTVDAWLGGEGGGALACYGTLNMVGCVFRGNSAYNCPGGGVYYQPVSGSDRLSVVGCTLAGNRADFYEGGGLYIGSGADAMLDRTIFAFGGGGGAIFSAGATAPTLVCCDIYGNAGGDWVGSIAEQNGVGGNFSADPLFCDPEAGDLSLWDCSPCLPGFHPGGYDCGGVIGAFGAGCGCGPAVEPTTWGTIKAIYR